MKLRYFFFLAIIALSGCKREDGVDGKIDIPNELAHLRSNAFQCWQDSQHVPVENSEHCVAVSEDYFDAFREECDDDRSYDCMNYNAVLADIQNLYGDAIVEGLINFGIPDWIKKEGLDKVFSSHVYFDGDVMRRLFQECLKTEKEQLARSGLQPVTTIIDIPLQEGQRCFRLGYPEFKTVPVVQS